MYLVAPGVERLNLSVKIIWQDDAKNWCDVAVDVAVLLFLQNAYVVLSKLLIAVIFTLENTETNR